MATLSFTCFHEEQPQRFSLLEGTEEMEAMADVTLVADGLPLPVHSQVLSLQSSVLRTACSMQADVQVGQKRKAGSDELVLEEPFQGCSVLEAVLFLRFAYHPRDVSSANLAVAQDYLPALLRLAHKLDAGQMLRALCDHISEAAATADKRQLVDWIQAADGCQLADLRVCCITHLARQLAGCNSLACSIADAAQLECCDKSTLLLLLGMTAHAGGKKVASNIPSPAAAASALLQSSNPGTFTWTIERWAEQDAAVCSGLRSPWFAAGGRSWQVLLYPGGKNESAAGHVSAYIVAKEACAAAKISIALMNQETPPPGSQSRSTRQAFKAGAHWGWIKFVSNETLHTSSYLAGDKMVIHATVELML